MQFAMQTPTWKKIQKLEERVNRDISQTAQWTTMRTGGIQSRLSLQYGCQSSKKVDILHDVSRVLGVLLSEIHLCPFGLRGVHYLNLPGTVYMTAPCRVI